MAKPAHASVFVPYPPGFRPRRGLNWAFIGLLYTSFYMCRYNLPLASGEIRNELGFSKAQIGSIITTALLAFLGIALALCSDSWNRRLPPGVWLAGNGED